MIISFIGPNAENLCGNDETKQDKSKYAGFVYSLASKLAKLCELYTMSFVSNGQPGFPQLAFWAADVCKRKLGTESSKTIKNSVFTNSDLPAYKDGIFGEANVAKMLERADSVIHDWDSETRIISTADVVIALYNENDNADEQLARMFEHAKLSGKYIIRISYCANGSALVPTAIHHIEKDIVPDETKKELRAIFNIENFVDFDADCPIETQLTDYETNLISEAYTYMTKRFDDLDEHTRQVYIDINSAILCNTYASEYSAVQIDCLHQALVLYKQSLPALQKDRINAIDKIDDKILKSIDSSHRLFRPEKQNALFSLAGLSFDCISIASENADTMVKEYLDSHNINYSTTSIGKMTAFHVNPKDYKTCNDIVCDANTCTSIIEKERKGTHND